MIVVTPAAPSHAVAIAELTEEMDRFYGATDIEPLDLRLKQIKEAIFGDPPTAHVLLAWNANQPIGFATYSFLWPAVGLTRSLFVKELYVLQTARRAGVGRALMKAIFQLAVDKSCSRVEWQTEITNNDAQDFYADLGATQLEGKVFYRVEDTLPRLAADQ